MTSITAASVSRNPLSDIPTLLATFSRVMVTNKGPIAPRLTRESLAAIFSYAIAHLPEMSSAAEGFYYKRPSETGLERAISWSIEGTEVDFIVHCNKTSTEGGDQKMFEKRLGQAKDWGFAFSAMKGQRETSGSIRCFSSDKLNHSYSSARIELELNLQRECSTPTEEFPGPSPIAPISHHTCYPLKNKEYPALKGGVPTHKYRFVMPEATADLFDAGRAHLPSISRLGYSLTLLEAVAYLHGRGVVHGDLKLENFLLFGESTIRLTDFGAALKALFKGMSQMSTPILYDPEFFAASPESLEAGKSLDCWQLGLLLTELCFGLHPVHFLVKENPTSSSLVKSKIESLRPDWVRTYYSSRFREKLTDIPAARECLLDLLERMLHPKRSERPSLEECRRILFDILETALSKAS